jgi:hypothetical protein
MRMCILAVAVFFASACTIRPEINVAEFCEENPNTRLCTEIDVNGFIEDYTESHQGGTRWENAEPDGEGTTDNDVTLSTGYFHLQGVWEALSGTSENTEGVEEGESTGSEPYELNFENMCRASYCSRRR